MPKTDQICFIWKQAAYILCVKFSSADHVDNLENGDLKKMGSYKFAYKKRVSPITAITYEKPALRLSSVRDVEEFECKGPWKTKSEGDLSALFALPFQKVQRLFKYDEEELSRIPKDIRGLRSFRINNIRAGKAGGGEFHRVRTELIFALKGTVRFVCKDSNGTASIHTINKYRGILIPPFIQHSYEAIEDADLLVFANTLFDPESPETLDVYSDLKIIY
jgi:hypothetical protein